MMEMAALRRTREPIDWKRVPLALHGKVSAVCCSAQECEDLVAWYGDGDFCPFLPVLLLVPGTTPTLIAGQGYATAAELRDCAVVTWHQQTARIAEQGTVLDFEALRERHGLMRREKADAAIREAIHERVRKHKRNPVTDPFREPQYPRVNGKTVHPVAKAEA